MLFMGSLPLSGVFNKSKKFSNVKPGLFIKNVDNLDKHIKSSVLHNYSGFSRLYHSSSLGIRINRHFLPKGRADLTA